MIETLPDQTATVASVLTFTFSGWVNRVYVGTTSTAGGLWSRVSTQTPSATHGIPVRDNTVLSLPLICTTINVYAPTGVTVMVAGVRE